MFRSLSGAPDTANQGVGQDAKQAREFRVLRVGETRVSLDTVIYAYKQGATPEEIVADPPFPIPCV